MGKTVLRVAGTVAMALCAVVAWGQPPFRHLQVVAFDKSGQPVTDLTDKEMKVTDDGKPQPIVSLLLNDNRPTTPPPLGPQEYSNQAGARPSTTLILFDLLNGTFADRNFVSSTILRSIEGAENKNSIYLYILTNKATLYPVRPLPKAGAAPSNFNWDQAKTLIDSAIDQVYGLRPIDEQMEGNREILALHALRELGGSLAAQPGPKSIVWTTQGFPMPVHYGGYCHDLTVDGIKASCSGEYVDFEPVVRHLAGMLDQAGISMWPVDESQSAGTVLARGMLDTFSGLTGARTYARGQTPAAVTDAFKAMRLNYTLAYRPAEKNWNGKFHKVKVTTTRKNVQIMAEDGYDATPPPDQTGDLIQSASYAPADVPEIALRAAVGKGAAAKTVRIQVKIGPAGLLIVPQDNHYTGQLAIMFVGMTDKGPGQLSKPKGLTLSLTPADWENAKNGIAATEEIPIPDSVNEVRVIVVDQWTNRVGSLTIPKTW